jgi:hypothetical protein
VFMSVYVCTVFLKKNDGTRLGLRYHRYGATVRMLLREKAHNPNTDE